MARTKARLPEEAMSRIRALARVPATDPRVRRANRRTRLKVLALHLAFVASIAGDRLAGGHPGYRAPAVLALGLFVLPFLRVFMHSQSHWAIGDGRVRNFLLDRFISLPFSISQTGYRAGHVAHHLYDNDHDPRGLPRDLQSTYVFSRDGRPAPIWKWVLFYMFGYQLGLHFFHVVRMGKPRDLGWYALENAAIVAMHGALWALVPGYYLAVYLPALLLGWLAASIALYMMHHVDARRVDAGELVYHAVNSVEPFFNWFGDNDGYHIEHSLFANVHPVFLREVNAILRPPAAQELHLNYVLAGLKLVLSRRRAPAAAGAAKVAA